MHPFFFFLSFQINVFVPVLNPLNINLLPTECPAVASSIRRIGIGDQNSRSTLDSSTKHYLISGVPVGDFFCS